jgi:hypothetical protein
VIGKHKVSDRWNEPSNVPDVVVMEITVLPDPEARSLREWTATIRKVARWPAAVALALLVAILAAALTLPANHDGGRGAIGVTARESGPAGVAAAYGYPLRCLSITILAVGQRYARADFNHGSGCGRFTGYSTAIFLRVMGAWRPVLKAVDERETALRVPGAQQMAIANRARGRLTPNLSP